jgi:myo-inositol-1-phosphate synthase
MNEKKTGVWLIGALGSISVTVMIGALALRKGLGDCAGMVTSTEPFDTLGLVPVDRLEFGGCDVRGKTLRAAALDMIVESGVIDSSILKSVEPDLASIEGQISTGTAVNCGEAIGRLASDRSLCWGSIREEIERVVEQIARFRSSRGLDEVVVVNLASTEPPLEMLDCHRDLSAFETCLDEDRVEAVRAGTIYAYAAIGAGCPYINFTPSTSSLFPAMIQLAEREGVPVMGNDGKTGETLVKSALAPMFTCRNLEILSWEGFNILGNMDGRVLDHPDNRQSKINSKDAVLEKILGYQPHSQVHIDYVPSLADQKTAWDFIHFRGFLGTRMSLQFIWQGYDSLLAGPLVLDLVRLAELAKRRGEAGLMPHLASYFKDPLGVSEHRLYHQFRMLTDYVENKAAATPMPVT